MLEELHRRNYAASTIAYYIQHIEQFARFFNRSPDRLTPTHLRTYQAHLLRERKLAPRTVRLHVCAIRFFFVKTLKRRYSLDDTPYPKVPRRLPQILRLDEVTHLIDAAQHLSHRTMLMVLYSNSCSRRPVGPQERPDLTDSGMPTSVDCCRGPDRYGSALKRLGRRRSFHLANPVDGFPMFIVDSEAIRTPRPPIRRGERIALTRGARDPSRWYWIGHASATRPVGVALDRGIQRIGGAAVPLRHRRYNEALRCRLLWPILPTSRSGSSHADCLISCLWRGQRKKSVDVRC
jgi:hypothetical protein